MAKLYGMANQIMSEMLIRLMTNEEFYKLVYYKDAKDTDILSMPNLDDPITTLYKEQVWPRRRPQTVLHEQDVHVFLSLTDFRNENARSKNIKTMTFSVGLLVHENCIDTYNGNRDIALLECIQNIIENDKYFNSLGECGTFRVTPLYGIALEYSGFELICKIDGIKAR